MIQHHLIDSGYADYTGHRPEFFKDLLQLPDTYGTISADRVLVQGEVYD